jgi:hypothetical protein
MFCGAFHALRSNIAKSHLNDHGFTRRLCNRLPSVTIFYMAHDCHMEIHGALLHIDRGLSSAFDRFSQKF